MAKRNRDKDQSEKEVGQTDETNTTEENEAGEHEALPSVVTEDGDHVGTWPDNGQPQKAGDAGEESPQTESNPETGDDKEGKDETPINPQKAGEAGEKEPESASTAEDLEEAGGDSGGDQNGQTQRQRKIARVVQQIADLSRLRDRLIAEEDEDKAAGSNQQRKTQLEAYRENVARQRENRQEARERYAAAGRAAGGSVPQTDRAAVDNRRRA